MPYRLTRMGHQWYAKEFRTVRGEVENIEGLLEAGDHTLIVADLYDAERLLDIESDDIIVVGDE
jgi:hypothetical protein